MAVPAHDERDFQFAQKFGIPIIEVIHSDAAKRNADGTLSEAYVGDGDIVNSDYLNGLNVEKAKETIVSRLEKDGKHVCVVTYPDALAEKTYDIVVANILSNPLKLLAPALLGRVGPGGSLVLSGVLARQAEEVIEVYRQADPSVELSVWQEESGWVCIAGSRKS